MLESLILCNATWIAATQQRAPGVRQTQVGSVVIADQTSWTQKDRPTSLGRAELALSMQGRSVSDFIVAVAREVALKTIEETHNIRLSLEDQERFIELLLNPPPLTPAMKRAKAAHARLIRKSP